LADLVKLVSCTYGAWFCLNIVVKLQQLLAFVVRLPYARNSTSSKVPRWRFTKKAKNTQGTLSLSFLPNTEKKAEIVS